MGQTIAVDVDDVLLPLVPLMFEWYNSRYGTSLTLADNESADLKLWGAKTEEEAIRRVHNFYETEEFKLAQPFEDAKRALRCLAERFDLVVITARDNIIELVTKRWLDEHFAELIREVHFTAKYSLEGKARKKVDVCIDIGASYLIDDSVENCNSVMERGIQGVLFGAYPWNSAKAIKAGVVRCENWQKVLEYFDERH